MARVKCMFDTDELRTKMKPSGVSATGDTHLESDGTTSHSVGRMINHGVSNFPLNFQTNPNRAVPSNGANSYISIFFNAHCFGRPCSTGFHWIPLVLSPWPVWVGIIIIIIMSMLPTDISLENYQSQEDWDILWGWHHHRICGGLSHAPGTKKRPKKWGISQARYTFVWK